MSRRVRCDSDEASPNSVVLDASENVRNVPNRLARSAIITFARRPQNIVGPLGPDDLFSLRQSRTVGMRCAAYWLSICETHSARWAWVSREAHSRICIFCKLHPKRCQVLARERASVIRHA